MAKKGIELPPEGEYGSGIVFLSPDTSEREAAMQVFEHVIREEGQKFIGWRTVPVKSEILGKTSGRYEPSHQAGVHRQKRGHHRPDGLRAQALHHPQARRPLDPQQRDAEQVHRRPRQQVQHVSRRGLPLRDQSLGAHDGLQGHAHALPARGVFPGSPRPGFRVRAGADAHPFLDQHLPELVARPPEPLHRPQRRDQHGDGQRQLHEGPPGALPERQVRR